jgi:hypothetical protein
MFVVNAKKIPPSTSFFPPLRHWMLIGNAVLQEDRGEL